jgi:DNA-binding NarL/FixJ family response regulator
MTPKILLVDDNPAWGLLLPEILKVMDIKDVEIVEANSAEEGVKMFDTQKKGGAKPNLVLMDVMLPGISGDAATRIITEEDITANVYGFTMFDDPKIVDMMKQAGVRGVISKQDSVDVMAKKLKAALDDDGRNE